MTDFDKLIKEKAEQAEYTYKPSAWRNFQRKTGIGHGALKYWVAGVSSVVLVGGVTVFMLVRGSDNNLNNKPTQPVVDCDTTNMTVDNTDSFGEDTLNFIDNGEQHRLSPNVHKSIPEQAEEVKEDVTKRIVDTIKRKTVPVSRYRKPLVINVDTIKENEPTEEELRNGHSRLF